MDKLRLVLIYTAGFLLQCTVFNTIAVLGVTPNVILMMTAVYSFFFKKMDGLTIGVVFGILQDMLFGQIIGISALIYLILGMILKFMRTVVFKDNRILLLFVVIFSTLFYTLAYWLLSCVMLQTDLSLLYSLKRVPISIVMNFIVLLLIVPIAKKRRGFTI